MQFKNRWAFALALALSLGAGLRGQQEGDPALVRDLVQEAKQLMTARLPMQEWPERNRKIAAWLERVQEQKIELGEHAYLVGLAHYFARDYDRAGTLVDRYLAEHGDKVPDPALETVVGRVMLHRANMLAESGASKEDFLTAVDRCLALYDPRATIYRVLGLRLAQNEGQRPQLHALLAKALQDAKMSTEDREQLLRSIYTPRPARPAEGPKALKEFTAKDLDGQERSLAGYRGKVLLVDFWATWCGPCLREMPHVVKAYERFHDQGFEVLAISLDREPSQERGGAIVPPSEDTIAKIRAKMKELNMTWPCIYEGGYWDTRLAQENGIRSIPATFLLDRNGKVRYTNLRGEELLRRVEELVGEK